MKSPVADLDGPNHENASHSNAAVLQLLAAFPDDSLKKTAERLRAQFPSANIAYLRSRGDRAAGTPTEIHASTHAESALSINDVWIAPLAHPTHPLRHLDAALQTQRVDVLLCDLSLQTLVERRSDLDTLLNDAFHTLRRGGALVLRGASQAIVSESVNQLDPHLSSAPHSTRWKLTTAGAFVCFTRCALVPSAPSRHKKKAFVYNCYFDTGGGGERSTLDFAAALDELGYEVSLVSTRRNSANLESLKSAFGVHPRFTWAMRYFPTEKELCQAVRDESVEVFVNHTFSSYLHNPAPIGIYVAMFPLPTLPSNIQALLSYSTLCCISEFTEQYVKTFWYDQLKTEIIYPPISAAHQQDDTGSFARKERLILQIGRFNVEGHSKCQLEAIETFRDLQEKNILSRDWKLRVVGRLNSGHHNERYIERCRDAIGSADVELLTNASLATIRDLYRRATCLWQFTGFGLEFGACPQYCEHLGLVAMDCFSYGTVPIIYQRGGMVPLIYHGENGFCFGDAAELKDIMGTIAVNFGRPEHRFWYDQSKLSAERLSFTEYRDAVGASLWRIARDSDSLTSLPNDLYYSSSREENSYGQRDSANA